MKIFNLTAFLFLALLHVNLFGDFYIPDRSAFPAICQDHFDNNKATMHTWLEAEDNENIDRFRSFLKLIPRPFEANCFGCSDCGGVNLNLYDGPNDWPAKDAWEEIQKAHKNNQRSRVYFCSRNGPDHCLKKCWEGGYFRKWNHQYLHFFYHYLQYCSENKLCSCYWPEKSYDANIINNEVYELLKSLADENLIDSSFSKYWSAKRFNFDYYTGRFYGEEYHPNSHGMASSLTTYTFFYSQYHQILLSIASFIDANALYGGKSALDQIYKLIETIQDDFFILYQDCLEEHAHPKIYYELGMMKMHSGKIEDALEDISLMMELALTDKYKNGINITSEMYQQEGEAYSDLGMYDKAVTSLTNAIKKDPKNKEAYFQRASAYFETGNFELALSDYLNSEKRNILREKTSHLNNEFINACMTSMLTSGKDAAQEFIPSLLHSTYGLGECLWLSANHPVEAIKNFSNACYDVGECAVAFLKTLDKKTLEKCSEEFKQLFKDYDKLTSKEKGALIGSALGKYGIEFLMPGTAMKGVAAFKKLKNANRLCNLETMSLSKANKEVIIASAKKHAAERDLFFKNVKIHADRQNKHVPGKHNYIPGKSILEHSAPEYLIKTYGGTGLPVRGVVGEVGYQEIINFKEHIGFNVCEVTGTLTPTTWAKVHYSKDGAHIVPTKPR